MSSARDVLQNLAVAKAAEAVIHERVKALRGQADEMLLAANQIMGSKNAEVTVFGEKVGTLSVSSSKPRVYVADEDAYQDHLQALLESGDDRVRTFHEAPLLEKSAVVRLTDEGYRVFDPATGEQVPGLAYRPGGEELSTRLTGCSPADVMACLAREGRGLPEAVAMLGEACDE